MATHVKVIAACLAVGGAVLIALAFAAPVLLSLIAAFVAANANNDPDAAVASGVLGITGATLSVVLGVMAIPFIATSWGMFKLKPWSRIAGIILAVVCLPMMLPFGAVFGIYAMVILFKKETEALFVAPASSAGQTV